MTLEELTKETQDNFSKLVAKQNPEEINAVNELLRHFLDESWTETEEPEYELEF